MEVGVAGNDWPPLSACRLLNGTLHLSAQGPLANEEKLSDHLVVDRWHLLMAY